MTSLGPRLRAFGVAAAAFFLLSLLGALTTWLFTLSDGSEPPQGWLWVTFTAVPLWALVAPYIFALSRRFPLGRGGVGAALAAHAAALVVVLVVDGAVGWLLGHVLHQGRELSFWQAILRFLFLDVFCYAGILAVEHAVRYQRLSVERRLHATALEAQLSRAQLQALQMQLRPHFLFNALNTIAGLVRVDDKQAAVTMLAGLGELLRILLRSDGAQEVPVRQEIELIVKYLRIEQVRFGDQLDVDVLVEPGVEEALVPNLILQPLVENAVRHGIGDAGARGRVAVHVERVGPSLRLEVIDTGGLYAEERGSAGGIGLANTRERLERLYGARHRFDLRRSEDGTSAVIEIPFRGEAAA